MYATDASFLVCKCSFLNENKENALSGWRALCKPVLNVCASFVQGILFSTALQMVTLITILKE
jgi:hypothetical protein